MATSKPTELPRFAELDQLSPVSTNNVIEPPESYKKYGHSFREKYKRNFFNWLHRLTYEWLLWLDKSEKSGVLSMNLETASGTFSSPIGCTLGPSDESLEFDAVWCRSNNLITITPLTSTPANTEISGILSTPQATLSLGLQSGDWPESFLKAFASLSLVTAISDSKAVLAGVYSGVYSDPITGAPFTLTIPEEASPQGNVNDFYLGGAGVYQNRSGIYAGPISFMVDDV